MAEARYDFGLATRLDADALGEPGNRTFRLLVRSGSSSALIWIEKQQLIALAAYLEQILVQSATVEALPPPSAASGPIQDFPLNPTVEFKVGQLGLGHDPANAQIQLFAHDAEVEDPEHSPPTFTVRTDYEGAGRLTRQIAALAAAGRPTCPLCGEPMGPGPHQCPPERVPAHIANGHIH